MKVDLHSTADHNTKASRVNFMFFLIEQKRVQPEVPDTGSVDPELLQAQSTIERLARKYLVRSLYINAL